MAISPELSLSLLDVVLGKAEACVDLRQGSGQLTVAANSVALGADMLIKLFKSQHVQKGRRDFVCLFFELSSSQGTFFLPLRNRGPADDAHYHQCEPGGSLEFGNDVSVGFLILVGWLLLVGCFWLVGWFVGVGWLGCRAIPLSMSCRSSSPRVESPWWSICPPSKNACLTWSVWPPHWLCTCSLPWRRCSSPTPTC